MSFKIVVTPDAKNDLKKIKIYYNNIVDNLGDKFLGMFEIRAKSLAVTPKSASIRYDNIRCTLIKKFPYLIHYFIDEDKKEIVILRIFSTYKKPLWNE